jgi:RHS repeat-associated protein
MQVASWESIQPTGSDDGAGGYMPLAIVKGGANDINWVLSHHNAKPILLTNASGAVVAYSGHAVLGFPGQFANAVGLAGAQYYYNRYRDYNDATGRYIQADPIGLAGDANPYAYAMGNTLRYSDPTGLEGINFFNPNDRAAPTANMLVNARGGYFYVAGHGALGLIQDNTGASGPRNYSLKNVPAFVARLRRAGLRPGQTIVLAACNVDEDGGAFARAVAALTRSNVYATDDYVGYSPLVPYPGTVRSIFPRSIRGGAFGSGNFSLHSSGPRRVNRPPDIVNISTNGNQNSPVRKN